MVVYFMLRIILRNITLIYFNDIYLKRFNIMYKNFNLTDEERKEIMESHKAHGYKNPVR